MDSTKENKTNLLGRASVSASLTGSVTVEAVMVIPFFFYAAICLIWMLEFRAIQLSVRAGLQEAGKSMAADPLMLVSESIVVIPSQVQKLVVSSVTEERLNRSVVVNGSSGISCDKSYTIPGTGVLELKAEYEVKLPIDIFGVAPMKYQEALRTKAWTGYVKSAFNLNLPDRIVFITETGVVYHKSLSCTYLEPSIRGVSRSSVDGLRNNSAGKYYPCPLCKSKTSGGSQVYVTDYGVCYHSSLSCAGIKRTIIPVSIDEVKGRRPCSKCGG